MVVLSRVVRVGFLEKVRHLSRLEEGEGTSQKDIWRKSIHTEEAARFKNLRRKHAWCIQEIIRRPVLPEQRGE